MEIRSTSKRIRLVGQKSENHRGTSPKSTEEDLNLHLTEALDRFVHQEQSFFKAQLNLELCGENSPSIFNQPGDNSTRTSTSSVTAPPPHMEIRSTSTRIRQVGQKSENHRGISPKSTEEVSRGCTPLSRPPPSYVVGERDLNLHLTEALDRFVHQEQSFFKAQLNVELCGENSPSIFNRPGDNSTRTSTSSVTAPPPHMEIRSTSTRIRQVGQKSENQRGTSPKSTEEVSRGCTPLSRPPPSYVVGERDLNVHLAFTEDNHFLKAQLNVELCGETSSSIFNQPGDNSTRTSTSSTTPPPQPPLTFAPYPIRKSVALR
ncbi:hypothetical protein CDAR_541501 [Caerostris darwini]|uniref:Uncharacterized protein n=1 Tax=Caerostris darwini TaxID=1538125 RepID=A0AAV4VYE7_9ARAC|nr:hypothetical protein CDAR_541501 [Caerostris darwini]